MSAMSMISTWYLRYASIMFTYGSYRGYLSEYDKKPRMPFGTRIFHSFLNGVFYMSPYGLEKIIHTIDRAHIYMIGEESMYVEYPCYEESLGGKNRRVL